MHTGLDFFHADISSCSSQPRCAALALHTLFTLPLAATLQKGEGKARPNVRNPSWDDGNTKPERLWGPSQYEAFQNDQV